MKISRSLLLITLAVTSSRGASATPAVALAQAQDLGSNFGLPASAVDVSADGAVVIGTLDRNTNRTDAFRWTESGGLEILEPLNGTSSRAVDLSDDGLYATGDGSWYRAVRWGPDGLVLDLGTVPGGAFNTYSRAISGDGQTVVGEATIQPGTTKHAFVWKESTGMVDIHGSVGGTASGALDVSSDGSVVVGYSATGVGTGLTGFVWSDSGSTSVVTVPGFDRVWLTELSDDGAVAVGEASVGTLRQVFRWTSASGAVLIGPPTSAIMNFGLSRDGSTVFGGNADGPFLWTASGGYRVVVADTNIRFATGSADGSILYGTRFDATPQPQLVAIRWTEASGFEDLASIGGGFDRVQATSSDGSVAVGGARNPDQLVRAVRWREDGLIGTTYCGPAAANSANALGASISLSGTNVAGHGAMQLNAKGLPPFAFGFFLASPGQDFVMGPGGSQGNLCLGGAVGRYVGPGQIQQSSAEGRFSLSIDPGAMMTPSGPILPPFGQTWNFQAWFRDANPTATSNFTDAASVPIY